MKGKSIHYFSPWLKKLSKYRKAWIQIQAALDSENELYDFVTNSADIWVRDFMPFQRHDGEFVIYRYNPDYLQGKDSKYITNCRDAFLEIGGSCALSSNICNHTTLVIDGGNIISCTDKDGIHCIIMTTKVLVENPGLSHHEILFQLEDIFNAEIILIPWDPEEKCGHSDGMVRSIGSGKLLLNCYSDMDTEFETILKKIFCNRFDIYELRYDSRYRDKSWCHLNYLELQRIILVPTANIASDNIALKQIEEITGKKCIPISMASVIANGGGIHCISWTMDTQILLEEKIGFGNSMFQPQYR